MRWGASWQGTLTGRPWFQEEMGYHINCLGTASCNISSDNLFEEPGKQNCSAANRQSDSRDIHKQPARPAQVVRLVWLWPYDFSRGQIKWGRRLMGVAIFILDVSAVVQQTARSSVCLIAGQGIFTNLPKHSTVWNGSLIRKVLSCLALFSTYTVPALRGLFHIVRIVRQHQTRSFVVYDE